MRGGLLLGCVLPWTVSALSPTLLRAPAHAHVAVRFRHAAPKMSVTSDAVALFGNIRVPAALTAGASLTLGFAFQRPSPDDKPSIRGIKALNVAIGFLSVYSELLCVVISTHAINRLSSGGAVVAGVTSVHELFRADRALLQHWLGTYIHFMLGVFGIVIAGGIRGWLAVGPKLGLPLLAFTAAMVSRLLAAVNRGIVAQEFGHGNIIILLFNFLRTFTINTLTRRRWMDMISFVMLTTAFTMVARRGLELLTEKADADGDGVLSFSEVTRLAAKVKDELAERNTED